MWRVVAMMIVIGTAGCGATAPASETLQRFVEGPAGRLFVDDGGAGAEPPVLLLHSLAGNTAQWTPQIAHLRRTRRAVAIDLRGHGRSEVPKDGRLAPANYADDVRKVLDALSIKRAVLLGHSFGGGVAVAFVGQWPERAAGLLLVDPIDDPSKRPTDPSSEAFLSQLQGPEYERAITTYWSGILEGANTVVRQQVLADLRATPRDTVVGTMRAMAGFDAKVALARYEGPMLTVTSPLNEIPSSLHRVIARLPQEKVSGVSHWLHLDRPDDFNAKLDRFLASVPN